ncbi:hypothetical protein JCM16303_001971 [Sporobolomyces ruberrimus]
MTSTWPLNSFDSNSTSSSSSFMINDASPFDRLPYPYQPPTSGSSSAAASNGLAVPQEPVGSLRRARSSGALEFEANRRPSFQSSWSLNTSFSPSDSTRPSPPQQHREESYSMFGSTSEPFRRPSNTSTYSLANYSSTPRPPVQDNPRRFHRRTSSAQPAFFASSASTPPRPFTPMDSIASGASSDVSSRRTSMSYSFSSPASHRMQGQPSVEEVDRFLQDMNDMLGPDAMATLNSPTTTTSRSNGLTLTSTSSPPCSSPRGPTPRQTYNVSGVLLNEEEYRQYTHSENLSSPTDIRPRQYSSSQYFPQPSRQPSQTTGPPQPSPGYDLQRPRSAPPSPQVDLASSGSFAPFYSPPSPQPSQQPQFFSPAPVADRYVRPMHRRGSSVDATIPRTFVSTPSVPISYGYASYPTRAQPPPLTPPHYRSNQPVGYPPPSYYQPQSHQMPYSQSCGSSNAPSTPVSRMFSTSSSNSTTLGNDEAPVSPISPTSTRGGLEGEYKYRSSSTAKPSPSRGGGGSPKKAAAKGPISFINFSASDSKVLLSGVAPSGSSKKRSRDITGEGEGEAVGESKKSRK